MTKVDIPVTQAIRVLRAKHIDFVPHFYAYEERGGTKLSAASLNVPEHNVIKTIILETNDKKPLVCLMHGDQEISTKNLARFLGVKGIVPCDPVTANKYTGYMVGGTSPFGTTKVLPVYVESSILNLERIYINGGRRGFLVEINPREISKVLNVTEVQVAITNN